MFFNVSPLLIRRTIKVEKDKTIRSLHFDTRMNTHSDVLRGNVLSDGTKIDSLPCAVTIDCIEDGIDYGFCVSRQGFSLTIEKQFLLFYNPTLSHDSPYGDSAYIPANLHLQAYLPSLAFNEMWQAAHEKRRIIFHGKVEGLKETSHNPIRGGSTYEWDVNDGMKIVSSLSFREANPSEVHDSVSAQWEAELTTKYKKYSQMRRLCLDVACQIEIEAARRGVETNSFWDVLFSLELFYERLGSDTHELWSHQSIDEFSGHPFVEEAATGLLIALLKCPWLRCDELEWLVVDYFVLWEVYRFREQLKSTIDELNASDHPPTQTELQPYDAIYARMGWAYFCMRPSAVLSPYQIREGLLHAQRAGAAWNSAIFAILDRAVKRDPPVWMMPN